MWTLFRCQFWEIMAFGVFGNSFLPKKTFIGDIRGITIELPLRLWNGLIDSLLAVISYLDNFCFIQEGLDLSFESTINLS